MKAGRVSILLLLLAIVVLYISAQDDREKFTQTPPTEAAKQALGRFESRLGGKWSPVFADSRVVSISGYPDKLKAMARDRQAQEIFNTIIAEFGETKANDFRLSGEKKEKLGAYLYQQTLNGEAIRDAFIMIRFNDAAQRVTVSNNAVSPSVRPVRRRDSTAARQVVEQLLRKRYPEPLQVIVKASEQPELVSVAGEVYLAYTVTARVSMKSADGGESIRALREYLIDASLVTEKSDELVLVSKNRSHDLGDTRARIFDPNPTNTLNRRNLDPTRLPDSAYRQVLLDRLQQTQPTLSLRGEYVVITDREFPPTPSPRTNSANPDFRFRRGSADGAKGANFAAVMAYHHVDRMQHYVDRTLRMPQLIQRPIEVDVDIGVSHGDTAAAFRELDGGLGYLVFGANDDIFIAEDADVLAHEYGHAILARTTKGKFTIEVDGKILQSEARPIDEGFADYWAMSTHAERTRQSGHALNCFAEWVDREDCLRSWTSTSYDEFSPGQDHHDNSIVWSTALLEIFVRLGGDRARATTDALILKGHLDGAENVAVPMMFNIAQAIIDADTGTNRQVLCEIFQRRKIQPITGCS